MPSDKQLDTIGATLEQAANAIVQPPSNVENKFLNADSIKELAEAVHKLLENKDFSNDIKALKEYAKRSFQLVAKWLTVVLSILVLQAFLGKEGMHYDWTIGRFHPTGTMHFFLEEYVLLALIGGTTTGVIGVFLVVAKYLFPQKNS